MMRQVLVVALLVAVAVATIDRDARAYLPGSEYVYRYETISTSALKALTNQIAGLKINTTVRMHIDGQRMVTIQFEEPELFKVNQEVPAFETVETVLEFACTPLTGPEVEVINEQIRKPFTFSLVDGIPSNLQVDSEEPYWSVNIKRGFINMMQLNLEERNILEPLSPEMMDVFISNAPYRTPSEPHKMFRAYEEDLVGECETIYTVIEEEITPSNLHVSKIRNYDNCLRKPVFFTGLLSSIQSVHPSFSKEPVKTVSHADYHLQGSRDSYLVRKAFVKSHLSFIPFGRDVETSYTCITQKLELRDIVSSPTPIRLSSRLESLPALKMYIPLEVSSVSPQESSHTPSWVATQKSLVIRLLSEVVPMMSPMVQEIVPEKVAEIALILKKLPFSTLLEIVEEEIINNHQTDSVALKKKEILLDILPTLTRPDLVEIIKELVTRDIILPARAAVMINMMVLTVKPSPQTFDDLVALLPESFVTSNPMLKKSILLSTGILANKIKMMFIDMRVESAVFVPVLHRISQEFISLFRSCTTLKEKLDLVGVIGNAGLLDIVPELETIIKDIHTPEILRAKAIYALRKVAPFVARKVQSLLLPLYLKPTVPHRIRAAAFLMIMKTTPSTGIMQYMTHGLKKETSMEMVSFVYTYLKAISLSEDPLMFNMSKKAKLALREIRPISPGLMHTRDFHIEKYIESMGPLGVDLKIALINSGYSPIPDNYIAKLATKIFGKKIELLELGIQTSDLKSVLWNLIGPISRYEDFIKGRINVEEFLLPLTELVSKIIGSTDAIRNKMHTTSRPLSEKVLNIYFKMFDFELATTHLEGSEITDLITEIKSHIPEILSRLRTGFTLDLVKAISVIDASMMLPTPAGLPVSINTTAVAVMASTGTMRMTGLDSIFALFRETNRPVITLTTDVKPSTAVSVFSTIGTGLPFFKTLSKTKIDAMLKLPIKSEFTANLAESKFKLVVEPITTEIKPVVIKIAPMTSFVKKTVSEEYHVEDLVITSTPIREFTYRVPLELLSIPLLFKTTCSPTLDILRPKTLLFAPAKAELIFDPSLGVPTKFELEFKFYSPSSNRAASSSSSFSWFSPSSYRTASRDLTSLSFDTMTPEPSILSETKRELLVTFKTIGGSHEKEAKILISHMRDASVLKHQHKLQILSTPMLESETRPLKVVADSFVSLPEFFLNFVRLNYANNVEMLSKMEIKYGFSNTVERLAKAKVFYHRLPLNSNFNTVERNLALTPLTDYMVVPEMHRNSSALQGIVNATIHRKLYHGEAPSMPLNVTTEISFVESMVPIWMKKVLPIVHILSLKYTHLISDTTSVSIMPATNFPEKICLTAIVDPIMKEMTLRLMLPSQNNTISGVPVPMPFLFTEMRHTPALPKIKTLLMHGDIPSGWCAVTPDNYVHAYDLMSVLMPESLCEVVLVKDCSALNLFMVTAKKIANSNKKIVKILVPSKELEIIPTSGSRFEVKVNGEVITLEETPFEILEPQTNELLVEIIKKEASILVFSPKYGLFVETDGLSVSSKTSEFFRGQTCGVCGDSNSDMFNELRGPNMELYWSPLPFLHSYMIPTSDCSAEDIPSFRQHSYIPSSISSATCEKIYRNVAIQRDVNGERSLCISIEPVAHCARSCVAEADRDISKPFHCKPLHLEETRRLESLIERQPIYLSQEPEHIREVVSEPRRCAPRI